MSTYLERVTESLSRCETLEQAFDADNWPQLRASIIGIPVTITSARKMPSDVRVGIYAVIAFTGPHGDGRITLGGNGARMPLIRSKTGRLPVTAVLYTVPTPYGFIYKWKLA
jgi:hypothetical protein